jgi:hypothetical protein
MNEEQDKRSAEKAEGTILKSRGRKLEITGLGVVASLVVSFWSLVSDGTLPLSEYLVFLCLMLISAGAMVWRIVKLSPDEGAEDVQERLQPGVYRVSFREQ